MEGRRNIRNRILQISNINLSVTTILLLFFTCRTETQLLTNKCWFTAPVVQEEDINVQVVTTNSTTSLEGATSTAWNISATVTWKRPAELKKGGVYVIKLNQIPSFSEPSFCDVGPDETIVSTGEQYTFYNLEFGFLYEVTIYSYNATKGSKALEGATRGFATPDCFQATGDRRFCSGEEVDIAGAPIEPLLNHLCQNETWVRATISWFPPIQSNGRLTSYGVQHAELGPRGLQKSETTYVNPGTNQADGRIYHTITDLLPGLAYLIEITPYVYINATEKPGLSVEMTFISSAWQGPETTPQGPAAIQVSPDAGSENKLPLCPPELLPTTVLTTQPPEPTTVDDKPETQSITNVPTIIDENRLPDNDYLIEETSRSPPPKPLTVTVKVLIKEGNNNKPIAVVVSLLLCAILLGLVWLGFKVLKGRQTSAEKSVVVTETADSGNKAEKVEKAEEITETNNGPSGLACVQNIRTVQNV